MVLVKTDESKV